MKTCKALVASLVCALVLAGCTGGAASSELVNNQTPARWEDSSTPATSETSTPEAPVNPVDPSDFDITTYESPLVWDGDWALTEINGSPAYSFTATNTSDKTITYFEIWAFFYDASGNPILNENNINWEWFMDSQTVLAPGESHTPRANGYWPLSFDGVEKIYFFVNYIEYDDGSWEGISDEQAFSNGEILDAIEYVNNIADAWA